MANGGGADSASSSHDWRAFGQRAVTCRTVEVLRICCYVFAVIICVLFCFCSCIVEGGRDEERLKLKAFLHGQRLRRSGDDRAES